MTKLSPSPSFRYFYKYIIFNYSKQLLQITSGTQLNSILFAAGCENGNINIWKFDPNYFNKYIF
jgi:hypothetical protein